MRGFCFYAERLLITENAHHGTIALFLGKQSGIVFVIILIPVDYDMLRGWYLWRLPIIIDIV